MYIFFHHDYNELLFKAINVLYFLLMYLLISLMLTEVDKDLK